MDPEIQLDPHAARLLGVLVEKALTTPEQYPLSIHAATSGANQKSNREPVLSLSEDEVRAALERLIEKELARCVFPGGSRVDKYCHTGTSTLKVEPASLAVLAELLLRGPQTVAELRLHTSRMVDIESIEALHEIVRLLVERGLARRVAPGPGSRAERWDQTLCPSADATLPVGPDREPARATGGDVVARLAAVEAEVERLRDQLRTLAARLGETLD